jgi:hypothetical protein
MCTGKLPERPHQRGPRLVLNHADFPSPPTTAPLRYACGAVGSTRLAN